jgi:DNA replication and repair protein RecF
MSSYLSHFSIYNVRNIKEMTFEAHPRYNFFYGSNGAGKTSVLEAISCLYTGQSFKKIPLRILSRDRNILSVQAHNELSSIGMRADLEKTQERVCLWDKSRQKVSRQERLKDFPLQVIGPESFKWWVEGPSIRRAYMDYGVFHVKHESLSVWKHYMRALKQRNNLLKERAPLSYLEPWEEILAEYGEKWQNLRNKYLEKLHPYREKWLSYFLTHFPQERAELEITLYPGWKKGESLKESLAKDRAREYRLKSTIFGPHRADLLCRRFGSSIFHSFSRGQLKLFVCAMTFAQMECLESITGRKTVLLWDDMDGELDKKSRALVFQAIKTLEVQAFITGTEAPLFRESTKEGVCMFHVKHGRLERQEMVHSRTLEESFA